MGILFVVGFVMQQMAHLFWGEPKIVKRKCDDRQIYYYYDIDIDCFWIAAARVE